MEKIRTFIAINLNPDIKEYLTSLQANLSIPETKIKWIEKINLHLTLKFLGYITLEEVELLKSILKESTNQYSPFTIQLSSHLGIFPDYQMPRIIWVGIKEGLSELTGLYNNLENNLDNKGFPREDKDFSGHISIGRIKFIQDKTNFIQIIRRIDITNLSQLVGNIDLMESKLTPNGPIYKVIAKFPLLMS